MAVQAIHTYNNETCRYDGSSNLGTIVKSSALGGLVGLGAKYSIPLTAAEKQDYNPRAILRYCRKVTNRAKVNDLAAGGTMSPAQDAFVKMAKSKQSFINVKDTFSKTMGGTDKAEFKGIINTVDDTAKTFAKRMCCANKFALKKIRPAVPFVVAGVTVGFVAGLVRNIFKHNAC